MDVKSRLLGVLRLQTAASTAEGALLMGVGRLINHFSLLDSLQRIFIRFDPSDRYICSI